MTFWYYAISARFHQPGRVGLTGLCLFSDLAQPRTRLDQLQPERLSVLGLDLCVVGEDAEELQHSIQHLARLGSDYDLGLYASEI